MTLSECAGRSRPGRSGRNCLPDAPRQKLNRMCWEFELFSPSSNVGSSDAICEQSLVEVFLPSRTHAGILVWFFLAVVEKIEEADSRRHRCLRNLCLVMTRTGWERSGLESVEGVGSMDCVCQQCSDPEATTPVYSRGRVCRSRSGVDS
ncbi:hypothetical protein DL95DRAFT_107942 [Leptodontidium sp. 2 PMI_412]|nr:hypothetical protein DL95DRAFT_107942 [Leptodontidium sp. 2 PMI_412]